jgi:hypothetical protein
VLRSDGFAEAYGRLVRDGAVGLAEALRLSRMGASPWLLVRTALRHSAEWGAELLRRLAWLPSRGRGSKGGRLAQAVDLAFGSACPGAFLRPLLQQKAGLSAQDCVSHLVVACSGSDGDSDAEQLLQRLAADASLLASADAAPIVRHILAHACRTGSEALVGAIGALDGIEPALRDAAAALCERHSPHLVERVRALPLRASLANLVAHGHDRRLLAASFQSS